jgi:hypothetical protein
MDDAEADHLWYAGRLVVISQGRVGGRGARDEAFGVSLRAIVHLVQILVVVAIILLILNTED